MTTNFIIRKHKPTPRTQKTCKKNIQLKTDVAYAESAGGRYPRFSCLHRSLVKVREEVTVLEWNVGISKVGVLECSLSGARHPIPIRDPVRASSGVGELQLVISRERNEVFYLDAISVPFWVRGGLVSSMTRGSGTEKLRVVVRGVIEPNYNALPVMSVATSDVACSGLVLREVPAEICSQ